jgi:hypothetical protein
MTLSDQRKRRLLSNAGVWLRRVEVINAKLARECANFSSMESLCQDARQSASEARLKREADLQACMREAIDPNIDWQLYADLVGVTVTDVHVLAVALEHVYQACLHIETWGEPDAAAVADRFMTAWSRVRDLRNGLEHEEEYLADKGRYPSKVAPDWKPPTVGVARWCEYDTTGFVAVYSLGNRYEVKDSIAAALAVRPHLGRELAAIALRDPAA